MKAQFQHLNLQTANEAIHCFWVKAPFFGFHWHYHPEYEITYVHHGQGTRLVGDNLNPFEEGDFVFLGSNLPHTWITDEVFNQSSRQIEVLVLQFSPHVFSDNLLNYSELGRVKRLLVESRRGIRIKGTMQEEAVKLLLRISDAKPFERFHLTLALLNLIGQVEQFQFLASPSYAPLHKDLFEKRILLVCQYIHQHLSSSLRLEEVARLIHMNPTSFCRFFKKMTGQTFTEYVTDLRIHMASQLLLGDRSLSISEVAYRSGFNSQTLFNRSFLKRKKRSPREFRKLNLPT